MRRSKGSEEPEGHVQGVLLKGATPVLGLLAFVAACGPGLRYSDEEARRIANYDLDAPHPEARNILGYPYLDVVPAGKTAPRGQVFAALGLDDLHLGERRSCGDFNVTFLVWTLSPSYDLVCMTGRASGETDYFRPDREVYGIRIVPRRASPR